MYYHILCHGKLFISRLFVIRLVAPTLLKRYFYICYACTSSDSDISDGVMIPCRLKINVKQVLINIYYCTTDHRGSCHLLAGYYVILHCWNIRIVYLALISFLHFTIKAIMNYSGLQFHGKLSIFDGIV